MIETERTVTRIWDVDSFEMAAGEHITGVIIKIIDANGEITTVALPQSNYPRAKIEVITIDTMLWQEKPLEPKLHDCEDCTHIPEGDADGS